jgi:2-phospho-L-lactate/phosphoenolpyruvate guanylyltransferase
MALWAIVPVKPLKRGKSRLAGVLNEQERAELNFKLLTHTLQTLKSIPQIDQVLVVSRDQEALAMARDIGARTVQEHGSPGLNMALWRATMVAKKYSAHGVLILPADLPLLISEDIHSLIELAQVTPVVVVVPDRHREGTNALLVSPPGLIEYQFGPDSFNIHCQLAEKTRARLKICELPSLALDMDVPEDLELVGATMDGW